MDKAAEDSRLYKIQIYINREKALQSELAVAKTKVVQKHGAGRRANLEASLKQTRPAPPTKHVRNEDTDTGEGVVRRAGGMVVKV